MISLSKTGKIIKFLATLTMALGAGMVLGSTGTYLLMSRELAHSLGIDVFLLYTVTIDGIALILFGGALYILIAALEEATKLYRIIRGG